MIMVSIFTAAMIFFMVWGACRKKPVDFRNTDFSVDQRVEDLVARLTLEEKISQMLYDAPAIDRLGIPSYNWWNECLHGVARAGVATVFPQAIGMGAMWDDEFMLRIANCISDEARAKHHQFVKRNSRKIYQGLTFWSPNINIFRDPRWGRGMETYGEDPFLMGKMGTAFVKGLQGNHKKYLKVVATAKHFAVHSGPEPDRHTFDARVSKADLYQTFLPAFHQLVVNARAYSVMCAYNRYMGEPCCGSSELLQDILRQRWGFEGYVVSDCWAIKDFWQHHKVVDSPETAVAMAVKAGTDLNCGDAFPFLKQAVEMDLISESEIDLAVKRLFKARFKLGMFDPPQKVPYANIPYSVNNSAQHDQLALEAAQKSIVLLKNKGQTLPLQKDIKTLAVIGPNADDIDVLLGNYNGTPTNPITPLHGIRQKVCENTTVLYAQGCEIAENVRKFDAIPGRYLQTLDKKQGIDADYFNNIRFEGAPVFSRVEDNVDVYWGNGTPHKQLEDDHFAVRWSGYLIPPKTGDYRIGVKAFNGVELLVNDRVFIKGFHHHHPSIRSQSIKLTAKTPVKIELKVWDTHNEARAHLLWAWQTDLKARALQVARRADAMVCCMGLSPRLEGEEMKVPVKGFKGGDRVSIGLPDVQIDLLKALAKTGKPIVLVLLNGSALAIPWAEQHIAAIVEAWYPGQRGGNAVADVLFGDYNPAGRLPVTFYQSVDQLPLFSDYRMKDRTYRYMRTEPLYPFGHGLSYTRFEYSDMEMKNSITAGDPLDIKVSVKNSGAYDGEEVIQAYLVDPTATYPDPFRSLVAFKRIHLKTGESKRITLSVEPEQMAVVTNKGIKAIKAKRLNVFVGGKQPELKTRTDVHSTGIVRKSLIINGSLDL